MPDNGEVVELRRNSHLAGITGQNQKEKEREGRGDEAACLGFGYLRGLRERSIGVEFRYRDGNSEWFSYGHLSSYRFNPSAGLLLRFASDVVSLVLIRGSNLDAVLSDGLVNLTDRGFQRHRILWVREMDKDELRRGGDSEPTVDRIEVREFATQEAIEEWLNLNAKEFAR
jgi:hypothetical protein